MSPKRLSYSGVWAVGRRVSEGQRTEGLSLPMASRTLCRISGLWAKASAKSGLDGIIDTAAMQAAVFGSEVRQELGARHWGPIGSLLLIPVGPPRLLKQAKQQGYKLQPQLLSHTHTSIQFDKYAVKHINSQTSFNDCPRRCMHCFSA